MLVTPPGATLRARFSSSPDQAEPLKHAWGNLTHTLSGLFCSSLNFMVGLPRLYQDALSRSPTTHQNRNLPSIAQQVDTLHQCLPLQTVRLLQGLKLSMTAFSCTSCLMLALISLPACSSSLK